MSSLSQVTIYNKTIDNLLRDSTEDSSIKALCRDKISVVAQSAISKGVVFSDPEKTQAKTLAATLGVPQDSKEFFYVLTACHDFNTAIAESKSLEARLFNITAPPAVALKSVPIPGNQNHSILRHSSRPVSDLIILCKAFNPTAPRNIIPLTPERLALHNLTRSFLMNFSLNGELSQELVDVVPSLVKHFFPDDTFQKSCEEIRSSCYKTALSYLQTGKKGQINQSFYESVDALRKQAISEGLSPEELNKAVAMRAADLIVESHIKMKVEKLDLSKAPVLKDHKPLPPQSKETRRTFMINGGVASGKSSSQAIQAKEVKKEGVDWEDVLTINRDAYKPMLLSRQEVEPEFQEFFASYTEDEAFMLRDAILGEYKTRLQSDTAPHLYIDQVWPNADMMELAGDPEGRGLDLTIVQTPVENSFKMAHGRSLETGYHAVTAGVLGTHSGVPQRLLESIETTRKKGAVNVRIKIVANVAKGVVEPVAELNLLTNTGKIHNKEQLLAFFSKSSINTNAKRFSELYSEDSRNLANFEPMADKLLKGITLSA